MPITRFSPLSPTVDGTVQKYPAARQPEEAGRVVLVGYVTGTVIGLTLFAATAIVALGKPHLEHQLIKLVNRLFPVGPRREWLLTGWPRYAYLPHLPSLPPELAHLAIGATPMTQQGIEVVGPTWYQALQHRYNNSKNLVLMAAEPDYSAELVPDVRRNQGNLRNLITLCRRLEEEGVLFSETQTTDLDEIVRVLDSIL